jgi:hypothetical protein
VFPLTSLRRKREGGRHFFGITCRRAPIGWQRTKLTDDVLRGGGIRGQKKLPQYPQSLLCKDFFVDDVFCISASVTLFNIFFDFALMCPFFPFGTLTAFTFAPFIRV